MKNITRKHIYSCGQIEAFVQTHAAFTIGTQEIQECDHFLPSFCIYRPCYYVKSLKACECTVIYQDGWNNGQLLAQTAIETSDLSLYEQIGAIGGWTSRRPPRHYRNVTAERDAFEAHLHGEALKRFIHGWKQMCSLEHKRGV